MQIKNLNECITEAKRFVKRAEAAKERYEMDKLAHIAGTKEMGAVRRASLDLTRALADLGRRE